MLNVTSKDKMNQKNKAISGGLIVTLEDGSGTGLW